MLGSCFGDPNLATSKFFVLKIANMLCFVVPHKLFFLFYFICFYSILYTLYKPTVDCKEQLRTSPSWTNRKVGSPTIHIATANQLNCRKLLLGENRKC
jgi:hypothetical protein